MIRWATRQREERGAIAIMTAIFLSSLLLVVAAVGVDLGNAWARKQNVQKSVDVSALSAAYLLPRTSANEGQIYTEVANYLNKANNKVQGQAATITAANLHDGSNANGEVLFITNPSTGLDDKMRVIAPFANVDFSFAGAVGPNETDVNAEATVQVRTPIPAVENVLPMWLPSSCVYGPLAGDVAAAPPPSSSPSYTLNSPQSNLTNTHTTGAVNPPSATYAAPNVNLSVTINEIPPNRLGAYLRLSFGNTQWVDYRVTWPTATTATDKVRTVTINLDDPAADRVPDGATVTNPNDNWTVTSTVGRWEIWPIMTAATAPAQPPALPLPHPLANNRSEGFYPKSHAGNNYQGFFEVQGGGAVACNDHQRGNFGQLDSPRGDSTQKQTVYARNVAFGLDHDLAAFNAEPPTFECSGDNSPAGAIIDDSPPTNGANCLYVDPGNDPQGLTDGLLGGGRITQGEGRLEKPTNPRCNRSDYSLGGRSYNNDTLSCFLKDGYTLKDVAKHDGVPLDAFDISIYDSPRFFWVPVVYQGDRTLKKYVAIKTFAPVFLTDEHIDASGNYVAPTANNGLVLNPANKIQSLIIFGFNEAALPVKPNAPTTDYQNGTRGVVRLVG